MTSIRHHIPEDILASYVAGSLSYAFSLIVASHISLCKDCRARLETHEAVGGGLLEATKPAPVSADLLDNVLGALDAPFEAPRTFARQGPLPGPVVEALGGKLPVWRSLGMGIGQCVLQRSKNQSVRLLSIPPGQAVPDHGHRGLELTLVLQGAFSDETGHFGVGDLEVADEHLEHTPTALEGETCICLAATDARLKFNAFVPRMLQPVLGI